MQSLLAEAVLVDNQTVVVAVLVESLGVGHLLLRKQQLAQEELALAVSVVIRAMVILLQVVVMVVLLEERLLVLQLVLAMLEL
jgi:hypothetical protein